MTNTQIVQQAYDHFFKGDIAALTEMMADDVYFDDSAAFWIDRKPHMVPFTGVFTGKENVPAFFKKIGDTTEITRFEPVKFFENGEHVIVLVNLAGRFKTDGTTGESTWIMIWEVQNGKIKSSRVTTMPGTF